MRYSELHTEIKEKLRRVCSGAAKRAAGKNVMQIPKLEKIVVNIGQGAAVQNVKILEAAVRDLQVVTGQKPIIRKARKSIAGFKLREGMPIGCSVTLRGQKMYEFLDRLINITIPRIRDFVEFLQKDLTVVEISHSVSRNKLCFLRSITIKSIKFVV